MTQPRVQRQVSMVGRPASRLPHLAGMDGAAEAVLTGQAIGRGAKSAGVNLASSPPMPKPTT